MNPGTDAGIYTTPTGNPMTLYSNQSVTYHRKADSAFLHFWPNTLCGYFDVYAGSATGQAVFACRVNAYQDVSTTTWNGQYGGSTAVCVLSGYDISVFLFVKC